MCQAEEFNSISENFASKKPKQVNVIIADPTLAQHWNNIQQTPRISCEHAQFLLKNCVI